MFRSAIVVSAALMLAACSDPLNGLDRISDVELAAEEAAAQALPSEDEIAREGFFGTSAAAGAAPQEGAQEAATGPATTTAAPRRGGLLGLFRRDTVEDIAPPEAATADVLQDPAASEDDAAPVTLAAVPATESAPRRRGLFGRTAPSASDALREGPDARDVPFGTMLPYGVVARVCEAKGKSMGQKIEAGPARGYALYDSAPGSATARTYYITGFADGCPRQLTAANVLLGGARLYEQLHYGPGGENLPVAATDAAYEKIKRRVCGARKGKPCGAKIAKMERSTFFVSAYDSFGNSSRWSELLIHNGAVIASALKTNG